MSRDTVMQAILDKAVDDTLATIDVAAAFKQPELIIDAIAATGAACTPKILSLTRCAARCGSLAGRHDIYCARCREEITAEAWRLIEDEPLPEESR